MKTKTNAFSRFALAACFLLSGSFISPIAAQEASGDNQDATIKIMTYNTKSGKLAGGMGEICNIIRAEEPDFAVLQEIERNTSGNPGDIPMIMAEELGMDYYLFIHAKNIKEGGDYGNVILSSQKKNKRKINGAVLLCFRPQHFFCLPVLFTNFGISPGWSFPLAAFYVPLSLC